MKIESIIPGVVKWQNRARFSLLPLSLVIRERTRKKTHSRDKTRQMTNRNGLKNETNAIVRGRILISIKRVDSSARAVIATIVRVATDILGFVENAA